jgi:hypothetical protein
LIQSNRCSFRSRHFIGFLRGRIAGFSLGQPPSYQQQSPRRHSYRRPGRKIGVGPTGAASNSTRVS